MKVFENLVLSTEKKCVNILHQSLKTLKFSQVLHKERRVGGD